MLFTGPFFAGGLHWLGCLRDCLRAATATMTQSKSVVGGPLHMLVLRHLLNGCVSGLNREMCISHGGYIMICA